MSTKKKNHKKRVLNVGKKYSGFFFKEDESANEREKKRRTKAIAMMRSKISEKSEEASRERE